MTDRATEYARKVERGEVVCGKLHRLACMRHLRDLERQGTDDFPYIWVPELSEEILCFAETLTILEGAEPHPVKLFGVQHFDIGAVFGWVHRDTGYRRFRTKYKSVARQNGKTFENGITATYIAAFCKYLMGKLFTVATKKSQSKLAWDEVRKFILADEDLAEFFQIQEYKSLITSLSTGCTLEALSKESGLLDGFRPIFASVDELHQHRDGSIYRAMQKGARSLLETLISMITTRGTNTNSFCYEMDSYCVSVLEGVVVDETLFVDIHCLDDGDDYFDPRNFIKANPVLCQMEGGMDTMMIDAERARTMGGTELSDYVVKCLNLWFENPDDMWIPAETLKGCYDKRTLNDFRGCNAYLGIDLSHGGDLTSIALDFEDENGDGYCYSHSFMPRGRLQEHLQTDIAPYDVWARDGLITITGGEMDFKNDYKFILSHLRDILAQFDIKLLGIGYDPHNADTYLSDLESFGCPLLSITQSARFLNDATVEIQLLAKSGRYHIPDDNSLLKWAFRNATVVQNSFGEIKIDKGRKRGGRIDPNDAAICARTARRKLSGVKTFDAKAAMEAYLQAMKK